MPDAALNKENVALGKPKIGGAVFRGPIGTTLPTSADATLDAGFLPMGYVSEDGVVNSNSPSAETIKAWGGAIVKVLYTERPDEFKLTLIESKRVGVKKAVYGQNNVSGTLATGMATSVRNELPESGSWVIDMVEGTTLKRIVIPEAVVSELEDITYKDDDVIGYGVTLLAMTNSDGATHYEYEKTVSGTSGSGGAGRTSGTS